MSRILNCLLSAIDFLLSVIGMVCMISGLILMPRMPSAAGIAFVVGIPAFILGMVRDNRRTKQIKSTHQAHVARRVAELTQRPWAPNQSLVITGNTFNALVISILSMSIPIFIIYEEYTSISPNWKIIILFILFFLLLLTTAIRCFILLGKPICKFSKDKISIPVYGEINWKYIDKISLKTKIGRKTLYFLKLYLSDSPEFLKTICRINRLMALLVLGSMRCREVSISITSANEDPEVIAKVAIYLWHQATETVYDYDPELLDIYNEVGQYISEFWKKHPTGERNNKFYSDMKQLDADLEKIYLKGNRKKNFSLDMKQLESDLERDVPRWKEVAQKQDPASG
ncbi:hypothetical protein [Dentiradicibacter hellwigii]|uniref:Uncharacterized protein n=1 Tax=Dentiradicibacter hellwigii TaxID=3149053 RepID=A0ABV4UER7_9RHOO